MQAAGFLLLFVLPFGSVLGQKTLNCTQVILNATHDHTNCSQQVLDVLFHEAKNLTKQCSLAKQNMSVCSVNLDKALKVCSNKSLDKLLSTYKSASEEAIRYLCKDNAKQFTDFYNKNGEKCYNDTKTARNTCLLNNPLMTLTSNYTSTFCKGSKVGVDCVASAVKAKCEAKLNRKFFIDLYVKMRQATPCSGVPCFLNNALVTLVALLLVGSQY